MNLRTHAPRARAFRAFALALALSGCLPAPSLRAQVPAPTREERLLNGLRVLFFQRPGAPKVWMKLRVHSGAAFDLAGKEGMTLLLSDALFPDPSTRQYVAEELGGRLDVQTTYDAIEISLSGDAAHFDRLAEVLRNALLQMRLAPDEVLRLKEARLRLLGGGGATPEALADGAVAARLFGPAYPYGRPPGGTPQSLARVERADLMLARDRFLNPNGSTLAVVGPVDLARAMRTFRQFLGPWRKSDEVVPPTFRQPTAPDPRTLVLDVPGGTEAEVRLAARGLPRSDRDRAAAALLAHVAGERWRAALKDSAPAKLSVRHDAHALGGVFRMSASVPAPLAGRALEAARAVVGSLAASPATAAELEAARREFAAAAQGRPDAEYGFADDWLDSITYGHGPADSARLFDPLTPADVQRVAARLFRDAALAAVVAGDGASLRASLANLPGGIEAPAANAPAPADARPTPTPPAGRRP